MIRILMVEDDPDIQELLQNYLQEAGYRVITAGDGERALSLFAEQEVDLILLDLMLPGLDGYGVCEKIRKQSAVPIIMVTALDGEYNQIKGFDLQIDDYITKPFSIPILLRKIEAVLRRTKGIKEAEIIDYRELRLDVTGYKVQVRGKAVELTRREFELLKTLLQNQGRVLTRQVLLNQVWDYNYFGEERIVDTHIKNLRKKLQVDYIDTIRGVGYRIDRQAEK